MKLSPPKQVTFYVSVILAVLGVLGRFVALPIVSAYSFWILLVAFVLLALANMSVGL